MTASHRRHMAALAASLMAVGALSACTNSNSSSNSSSTPPASNAQTSAECDAGAACTTAAVTLDATTLTVATPASRGSQTLTAELVNDQTLHCTGFTSAGGALAIFSSTATDVPKTVTYAVAGEVVTAVTAAYRAHPQFLGCYASPHPFTGFVGGHRSEAPRNSTDNLYEAELPACGASKPKPCFRYAESGDSVTITVEAPAGDPKIIM